jgi:hypothetical protein
MIRKYEFSTKVEAIHALRVNVKSLAAEARIIRQEDRRAGPGYREKLDYHRRGRLREESRYAQLALAFIRGRAYKTVEQPYEPPVRQKLHQKICRFFPASPQQVADWLGQVPASDWS